MSKVKFNLIDPKILFIIIAATMVIVLTKPLDFQAGDHFPIDDIQYRQMAETPGHFDIQTWEPYGYRILGPWIAGFLFNDIDFGFRFLNGIFLVLLAITLWRLLLLYKFAPRIALLTALLFILNRYYFSFLAYEFYRINDTISILFLWTALILTKQNKFSAILPLLIVGLLAREILVLWVPVALVILYCNHAEKKSYLLWVVYSLLLFVLFVLMHHYIPTQGGIALKQAIIDDWNKLIDPNAIARQLFVVNSPLYLLPILFYRDLISFVKKYPEILTLLLVTYLSTLFGHDYERLMSPAAPFIYLFTATVITRNIGNESTNRFYLFSAILLMLALLSNIYHLWGIVLLPSRKISLYSTITLGVLTALWFWLMREKRKVLHYKND